MEYQQTHGWPSVAGWSAAPAAERPPGSTRRSAAAPRPRPPSASARSTPAASPGPACVPRGETLLRN